jgi:hypothetical protein
VKLSTRTKRVLAFAGIWSGGALLAALFATFPKVIAAIIMISCGIFLLVLTWQLVASYIDE